MNFVLYDWLSFTVPVDGAYTSETGLSVIDGSAMINLLGMSGVQFFVSNGVNGYSKKLWFDGVNIHLPSASHSEVWVEMSGSGCRAFETYGHGDWAFILNWALRYAHFTRLDIAFDDHTGILDMQRLVDDSKDRLYVTKARKHEIHYSWSDDDEFLGLTIEHGSMKSDVFFRFYDKAAQLYRVGEHWIRLEMQLRNDRATSFVKLDGDLGSVFSSVLLNYCRYVIPNDRDSNKWRWELQPYWVDLIGSCQPLKLAENKGVEYNFQSLDNFVIGQAGNSLRCFIQAFGVDYLLARLKETQPAVMPEKYRALLEGLK